MIGFHADALELSERVFDGLSSMCTSEWYTLSNTIYHALLIISVRRKKYQTIKEILSALY